MIERLKSLSAENIERCGVFLCTSEISFTFAPE
jgi:hypothetical protein